MLNALEQRIINRYNSVSILSRFSGCIFVAKDTEVLAEVNLGFTDYEQETRFTSDTAFPIASISKMFTAACILLLKEQGKLKLTDSIGEYFPDYKNGANVTIKQLLGHVSGIPEYIQTLWESADKIQSLNEIFDFIKNTDMDFEVGSRFGYSSSNYLLLGFIIEKASGKSYGDFLAEHIFKPLDMTHSGYIPHAEISMAIGYDKLYPLPMAAKVLKPLYLFAGGGIYSCANDLFKWSIALFNGKVLTRESLQAMITADRGDYGLGIQLEKLEVGGEKYTIAQHKGGLPGLCSEFARILETRHTIILLCNARDISVDPFIEKVFSEVMDCVNSGI